MTAKTPVSLDMATFRIPNMVCDGCAERIRNTLTSLVGVRGVNVGVWRKRVRVSFDPMRVGRPAIVRALEQANFHVAEV